MLTVLMAFTVLGLMVLYFRFLFGYFIRNFERQADLHVFKAIGNSQSIISAFEKLQYFQETSETCQVGIILVLGNEWTISNAAKPTNP